MSLVTIYALPKLRSTETTEKKQEDLPLFVDVEIIKRDEETGGWTSEIYPLGDKEVS